MSGDEPNLRERRMRIREARGRSVTQLDPVTMHLMHRHDLIDAETLRVIAEEIGPGHGKWRRRWFWIFEILPLIAIPVLFIRVFIMRGGRDSLSIILWSVIVVCVVIAVWGFAMGAKKLRFGRVRDAMLKYRRCPHCGYNLRGLMVAPTDGATLCPECGCAWKIDPSVTDEVTNGNSRPQQ